MKPASEYGFLVAVLQLAKLTGWLSYHPRPARTARGWRTAVSGSGAGYPDVTLARGGRLLFLELKAEGGQVRPEQRRWLSCLRQVPGVEVYLLRPSDWPAIEQILA